MFIVISGNIVDGKMFQIFSKAVETFASRSEAENEAKRLTTKHNKVYYVLSVLDQFDTNVVVNKQKMRGNV